VIWVAATLQLVVAIAGIVLARTVPSQELASGPVESGASAESARVRRAGAAVAMVAAGCVGLAAALVRLLLLDTTMWTGSAAGVVAVASGVVSVGAIAVSVAAAVRARRALTHDVAVGEPTDASAAPSGAVRWRGALIAAFAGMALAAGVALTVGDPGPVIRYAGPFVQRQSIAGGEVEVEIFPTRVGRNEVHVYARRSTGTLMGDIEGFTVRVRPDPGASPIAAKVTTITGGHLIAIAQLDNPGAWTVDVVGTLDGAPLRVRFTVPVGA
jgi:hypothetical protein